MSTRAQFNVQVDVQRERIKALCIALESGRYSQTQSTLQDAKGYCCLGVACDVSGVSAWSTMAVGAHGSFSYGPTGETSYLPAIVVDWYGFISHNPLLKTSSGEYHSMSALNDDDNYTFTEIAQALRRTYLVGDETTIDGGPHALGE